MGGDYAIGPGDRIDVSVLSRPELSRVYRVRPDGSISMHIVGAVRAEGLRPAEFEAALETRLAEAFESTLSTTVEVVEYRPVIVGGAVEAPGAYPFLAGLDAAGALALAGGVRRYVDGANVTAQMRVEAEVARYALLRARLAGALIERARLVAERDAATTIQAPEEAREILQQAVGDLETAQAALRAARDEQLSLRIAGGRAALELAEGEASAYAERQNLIRRQLNATLEELGAQEALSERGLARTQRLLDLRVSADRYRADELEAVALEAEARQRVSDAEAQIDALAASRATGILEAIAASDAEIVEMRTEIEQARRFVTLFSGGSLACDGLEGGATFSIRRRDADRVIVLDALPGAELVPGDMLQVDLVASDQSSCSPGGW